MKWIDTEENLRRFFEHVNNTHLSIKCIVFDTTTTVLNGEMSTN